MPIEDGLLPQPVGKERDLQGQVDRERERQIYRHKRGEKDRDRDGEREAGAEESSRNRQAGGHTVHTDKPQRTNLSISCRIIKLW